MERAILRPGGLGNWGTGAEKRLWKYAKLNTPQTLSLPKFGSRLRLRRGPKAASTARGSCTRSGIEARPD